MESAQPEAGIEEIIKYIRAETLKNGPQWLIQRFGSVLGYTEDLSSGIEADTGKEEEEEYPDSEGGPASIEEEEYPDNEGDPASIEEEEEYPDNEGDPASIEEEEEYPDNEGDPASIEEEEEYPDNEGGPATIQEEEYPDEGGPASIEEEEDYPDNEGSPAGIEEEEEYPDNEGSPAGIEEEEEYPDNEGSPAGIEEEEEYPDNEGSPAGIEEEEEYPDNEGGPASIEEEEEYPDNEGGPASIEEEDEYPNSEGSPAGIEVEEHPDHEGSHDTKEDSDLKNCKEDNCNTGEYHATENDAAMEGSSAKPEDTPAMEGSSAGAENYPAMEGSSAEPEDTPSMEGSPAGTEDAFGTEGIFSEEEDPAMEGSPAVAEDDSCNEEDTDLMITEDTPTGLEGCPALEDISDPRRSPDSSPSHVSGSTQDQSPIVNGSKDSSLAIHCADLNQDDVCTTGEGEHGNMDSDGEFAAEAISSACGLGQEGTGQGVEKGDLQVKYSRARGAGDDSQLGQVGSERMGEIGRQNDSTYKEYHSNKGLNFGDRQTNQEKCNVSLDQRSSSSGRHGESASYMDRVSPTPKHNESPSSSSMECSMCPNNCSKESCSQTHKRGSSQECSISPSRKHSRMSSEVCKSTNKDSAGSSIYPSSYYYSPQPSDQILGEKDSEGVDLESDSEEAATPTLGNSSNEEASAVVTAGEPLKKPTSAAVTVKNPCENPASSVTSRDPRINRTSSTAMAKLAGSAAPAPQYSSSTDLSYKGPTPVNVWVVGDSSVSSVKESIAAGIMNEHLGFPEGLMNFKWFGIKDMKLEQVLPMVANCCHSFPPPQILVIHAGGTEIGVKSFTCLSRMIKSIIESLFYHYPMTKIVWSDMIPCLNWRNPQNKEVNRCRKKLAKLALNTVYNRGGIYVRHLGLIEDVGYLFMEDGVHLNIYGLDMFINYLKKGVVRALALLDP